MSGSDPDQLLVKAMELYEAGELRKALELLERDFDAIGKVRIVEGHLWALRILCQRELFEESLDEEEEDDTDWTAELRQEGASSEFLLAAGHFFSEEYSNDLACDVLEYMVENDRSDAPHLGVFNLALVHERGERIEEALDGYRKAIAMAPAWPQGHLYLARCLQDSGRSDEAIPPLTKYLEIEPRDIDEWISLGIIHSKAARFKSAELAYRRAEAIDAANLSLNFNRGITARRARDRDQLEVCLEALDEHAPEDWRTSLLRGYLNELDGAIWQAWEAFSEAAEPELLESDDDEAKECAATHALAFAVENQLQEQAEEMAQRCLSTFVLPYDVLYELRRMGNQHALRAHDFGVLIRSDLTDETAIRQLMLEDELGPPYSFFRSYRVIADTPEAAGRLALEFEERVGGANVQIEDVTRFEEVENAFLGVWWLARELNCFSKNAEDA